jgi:putative hydrolase of the HAD superfamily
MPVHIDTLFFDLDDTLYPPTTGLWDAIRGRMEIYLNQRLNIPWEEIPQLRQKLYANYGTTLRGLQAIRHIDTLDYLNFVHNVPLENYLTPDPAVRTMLLNLPQRKYIFTNADANHARRVISFLQLDGIFEDIIDILDIDPYCKPMQEAFQLALQKAGESDPHCCAFVDDAPRNLVSAHKLGFYTIRIGSTDPSPDWDASIASLLDLSAALYPNSLNPSVSSLPLEDH